MDKMKARVSITIEQELIDIARKREWNVSRICENALARMIEDCGEYAEIRAHTCTPPNDLPYMRANPAKNSPTMRNAEKVIHTLQENGMDETGTVSVRGLQRIIQTVIGGDPRTVTRYSEFMVREGYLVPAENNLLRLGKKG